MRGSGAVELGRALVGLGILLVAVGALVWLWPTVGSRVPLLGRLPGDIRIEREGWSLYVPLTSSILVSLVLSLAVWLLSRR